MNDGFNKMNHIPKALIQDFGEGWEKHKKDKGGEASNRAGVSVASKIENSPKLSTLYVLIFF